MRKKINQYLDRMYPKLQKTSLACNKFDRDIVTLPINKSGYILKNCYNCDRKNVILDGYTLGSMDNNIDEYYSGICHGCDEIQWFEPNYESLDFVKNFRCRNIIVIGDYLRGYLKPNNARYQKIELDEFSTLVELSELFAIDNPDVLDIGKKGLKLYIEDNLCL